MDPTSLTILGINAGLGYSAGRVLLDKLLSPSLDAIGEGIAAPLIAWKDHRIKRANATLDDAAAIIRAENVEPQTVPGRILWPILERSSLEDDEDLHRLWARLLATAASPHLAQDMLASFPHILSELSPIEARMLEFICEHGKERSGYAAFNVVEVSGYFDISHSTTLIHRDNLERLNLVARTYAAILGDEGEVPGSPFRGDLYVTALGYAFIRACTGKRP